MGQLVGKGTSGTSGPGDRTRGLGDRVEGGGGGKELGEEGVASTQEQRDKGKGSSGQRNKGTREERERG